MVISNLKHLEVVADENTLLGGWGKSYEKPEKPEKKKGYKKPMYGYKKPKYYYQPPSFAASFTFGAAVAVGKGAVATAQSTAFAATA
ncbi:hypothetical protein PCC7418_1092 [Halothece sp. PCC 7418]|nr:hypothetical protein PCC7418_1092 [Halothece sp. PCC 7418]